MKPIHLIGQLLGKFQKVTRKDSGETALSGLPRGSSDRSCATTARISWEDRNRLNNGQSSKSYQYLGTRTLSQRPVENILPRLPQVTIYLDDM
eukprot:g24494.t1